MTTGIHHGDPGSFKSFGTIQRVVIPAITGEQKDHSEGRTIVTNIRGLDSLKKIEAAIGTKVSPESEIINVNADSNQGFALMSRFFHWAPKGALIVIDEAQKVFSKRRDRDLKKYDLIVKDDYDEPLGEVEELQKKYKFWDGDFDRPNNAENAFDQHRHYNWDIYLLTPNIGKLHPEIREVAEIAYRHRCRGYLLPWWSNKWKEYAHDAESSGKSVAHYEGAPKVYTADKRIFSCYKSTKTGKAKRSIEGRPIYREPKIIFSLIAVAVIGTLFTIQLGKFIAAKKADLGIVEDPVATVDASLEGAKTGSNSPIDSSSPDADRFTELESSFMDAGHVKPEKVPVILFPEAKYLSPDYDLRLAALLSAGTGRLYYRIASYDGDRKMDEYSQDDINDLGFEVKKVRSGLILTKDDIVFHVRNWVVGIRSPSEVDSAMQGASAGGADGRLTPALKL